MIADEFRRKMADACGAGILTVNLDPRNAELRAKGAFRVCAPGGYVLVTTPNVARIGNVFKLLVGRSNFDRLAPVDYENPDDEGRPHFREYTLTELSGFFQRAGFEVVARRYVVAEDSRYNVRSTRQRLIDLAKRPFYAVPHLRGDLVVMGRKPR